MENLELQPKLLYVDDEFLNLELFRINFQKDYKVFTAVSAKEGLEILKNEKIKVVISDLRMPVMNGIELIAEIKKREPSTICVLLTAFIEPQVMLKAINEEMVFRYLTKPWKKEEVKKVIDAAFQRYYQSAQS